MSEQVAAKEPGIFSSAKAVFISSTSSIISTAEAVQITASAGKDLALMGKVAARVALIESIEQCQLDDTRITAAMTKAKALGINLD